MQPMKFLNVPNRGYGTNYVFRQPLDTFQIIIAGNDSHETCIYLCFLFVSCKVKKTYWLLKTKQMIFYNYFYTSYLFEQTNWCLQCVGFIWFAW